MKTISSIVEEMINEKPFLQEALFKGIVNNAALADELLPSIEKDLNRKVKFSAVNMAIRRYAEKLEKIIVNSSKFDPDCDILVRSDLVEIIVYKNSEVQEELHKLHSLVDVKNGDLITITQGISEIMIITSRRYEKNILKLFSKKSIKKVFQNLSSVTINIPDTAVQTVGLFYIVTRALNWENINIIDIVSTWTEMTYIVSDEQTARTYEALKKVIRDYNSV
jgi:hypothetical protein